MPTDIEFWDDIFTQGQKYRPLKDGDLDAILAHTGKPEAAADIGAGTGSLALALAQRGIPTTAFDISGVALGKINDTARERGIEHSVHTVQGNINDIDFGSNHQGSFDLIFMKLAIAFARPREQALERIRAMLRPGGSLVIITPVLLDGSTYDARQTDISVPREEFELQLKEYFSDTKIFSEQGDDPNWPLVTYICAKA
jgi:protein-L-isoaspartate(D-aspartate) O-methyltransferase